MPAQALTTEFLATLPDRQPASGAVSYFDTEIKGFLLEHRTSGGATFYFRYRDAAGKVRLNRIGRTDEISLSDARAKAHKMKQMVNEGGDPKVEHHRFRDVPTFAEFVAERYLPHAKTRKRSWLGDDSLLRNHLLPVFGAYRLNRITRSDVIAAHNKIMEAGYAAGTANRILVLLRFVFNCAIRWEVLPPGSNPTEGVAAFEDNGARERYLSEAEVSRLFDELETNPNRQACTIIKLLLLTGARKSEVMHARWEYVDLQRRILTVPLSKSGKPRYIALSDAAVALFESLPRQDGVPWVFYNPKTGKALDSIFCAWDTIRKRVGLPEVRIHDLRHSFASFLVNKGRSLYEVQKLLGHSNAKTTQRYAHLSPGALIEAANIVGDVVGRRAAANQGQSVVATA